MDPARLEAMQVYRPSNLFVFIASNKRKAPLSLLCSGRDPPLKFHVTDGLGIPTALHGKVTLLPWIATRFAGSSVNSGTTEKGNGYRLAILGQYVWVCKWAHKNNKKTATIRTDLHDTTLTQPWYTICSSQPFDTNIIVKLHFAKIVVLELGPWQCTWTIRSQTCTL